MINIYFFFFNMPSQVFLTLVFTVANIFFFDFLQIFVQDCKFPIILEFFSTSILSFKNIYVHILCFLMYVQDMRFFFCF